MVFIQPLPESYKILQWKSPDSGDINDAPQNRLDLLPSSFFISFYRLHNPIPSNNIPWLFSELYSFTIRRISYFPAPKVETFILSSYFHSIITEGWWINSIQVLRDLSIINYYWYFRQRNDEWIGLVCFGHWNYPMSFCRHEIRLDIIVFMFHESSNLLKTKDTIFTSYHQKPFRELNSNRSYTWVKNPHLFHPLVPRNLITKQLSFFFHSVQNLWPFSWIEVDINKKKEIFICAKMGYINKRPPYWIWSSTQQAENGMWIIFCHIQSIREDSYHFGRVGNILLFIFLLP